MSKKTKKKQKLQEVDEDVLLRTAIQEAHSQRIASGSSFLGSNDDLFKPNLRQMDAEAEIREKLSQSMMKAKTTKGHNASIKPIFKIKRNWPPFKTLGISFKMVKEDGAVKTFQAVHSPAYANLNLLFTSFRQVHDLDSITHVILSENPYHLESLFLLAHSYLMREEYTNASDTLERALFAISSSRFQFSLVSQEHQLNYKSSETRIIFQILFAFIQQLINRHCYNTALQFAKVLYMKDPVNDPLAVTLFIDFLAIRAGNYEYLSDLFENYGKLKNWDMLPNFLYNVSFAYHKLFEKTGDEKWKRKEKELVKTALIRFPSFVGALVDRLGLEPSDEVKKSGHFDTKLRCPKGIRILVNIVLKHSFDFWSQGYQLKWLQENATEFSKHLKEYRKEVTEWDAQCVRVFVGLPVNVKRHALLIGVDPETEEEKDFFDPFPPNPVVPTHDQAQSQGSLTGVIRSQFDGLMASLHNALDQIQQTSANTGDDDVPLPNGQEEGH